MTLPLAPASRASSRFGDGDGTRAFWPWVQIIRTYVQQHDPTVIATLMGAGAADIARVVPDLYTALPHLPQLPALQP